MDRTAFVAWWTLAAAVALGGRTAAQCTDTEEQKLVASDGQGYDMFGNTVAVSGDALLVAMGFRFSPGEAILFRHDGSRWNEEQKLVAKGNPDYLSACALSGNVAVVGAPLGDGAAGNSGVAWVFRFDGKAWVEEQKLTASDGAFNDGYGCWVAVEGNVIVVGAITADAAGTDSGAAYVYRFVGGSWLEEQKLVAGDAAANDAFGACVALSGNRAVVGSAGSDGAAADAGAAYVFRYDGSAWSEERKLTASDGATQDWFGRAVAVDGDLVVAGAWGRDGAAGADVGGAYVFRHDGVQWVEEQILTPDQPDADDRYGYAVTVWGDRVVIGAFLDDDKGIGAGAAHVLGFDGTRWQGQCKLTASDGEVGDWFGYAVDAEGTRVAVGAVFDDDKAGQAGAAYTFDLPALALNASKSPVLPGDTLTLSTCGGLSQAPALLAVVDINGAPTFLVVELGVFDSAGQWDLVGTVPPGLSGLAIGFQSFGFRAPARLGASAVEVVSFQ